MSPTTMPQKRSPKPFYITTTLPYVNADPHIGFALEIVFADALARFNLLQGNEVFFNTGTDEHGVKVYTKAAELGQDTQKYTDEYAQHFKDLIVNLGLWEGITFIRTTDTHHKAAAQEFWKRCLAKGDIYKAEQKIYYCVGCELEKTDSELVDGKCPLHPNLTIEVREEENYFFAFEKYQQKLLDLYSSRHAAGDDLVVPNSRLQEIIALIRDKGLAPFSISRLATKMPWGIPVPGDEAHVMYVWFDALVNYISTLGWPGNENDVTGNFKKFWPVLQVAGKDQVRQQAAMWQAMLMSADVAPSHKILIHGFINGAGGVKMSKSLGNTVNPTDLVHDYGTDAVRYFLLKECSFFEDSDFTMERFKETYNASLANGIGNLVSRVMRMATTNGVELASGDVPTVLDEKIAAYVEQYEVGKAMGEIWTTVGELDRFIQEKEPFKLIKTDPERAKEDIAHLLAGLAWIAFNLRPFLPETAAKIQECLDAKAMPAAPLFLRKD